MSSTNSCRGCRCRLAYFRRIYGNFNVVDNEALSASDFTPYSVLVPTTSTPGGTLPGAGTMIGGLFDPNSTAVNNVIKDASAFGKQQAHWDGFDLSVDARLRNGLFLQGGVSSGKDMYDYCDIVDDVPEALTHWRGAGDHTSPLAPAARHTCGVLPPGDAVPDAVEGAGVVHAAVVRHPRVGHVPEPVRPADRCDQHLQQRKPDDDDDAGRPFTPGQATVNLYEPVSKYGDRLNQIDLRFTKIVNLGHGRLDLNVDFYNAFNSDAVIGELGAFGPAWRLPLTVIQPRFVKFAGAVRLLD